ncbi:hypothetical protein CK203_103088 [Vitis vinifera]|uniref:Reverse transcriptase domain-containing protein n=1 Tax=Vitis vinifera TaxID=29760 RepID=A0A438CVM5_VITVI|nr:hypothetical protein CK203_103088 [Vitis vinifera]
MLEVKQEELWCFGISGCWSFLRWRSILIEEREDFWAELGVIMGLWMDPWCIGEVIDELGIEDLTLSDGEWRPSIEELAFNSLSPADSAALEDRLDVVKDEVLGFFFGDFYESGCFERSLNATFVVLVLRKGRVEELKDFRPISLVGGLCKLLAKVLANRFKKVVGSLVWDFQHAFVGEKAYDHVNWNYVIAVMDKMGFSSKWLDDILIFCDASKENLEYLSWVFMWFEACLSLKINLEKSELIPIGEVPNLEEFAEVLGCKVGSLPSTYLGLPLGAPYKSSRAWEGVEERFPKKACFVEETIFVKRWKVIVGKYGIQEAEWCTKEVRGRYGVGVWKTIRNGWEVFKDKTRLQLPSRMLGW